MCSCVLFYTWFSGIVLSVFLIWWATYGLRLKFSQISKQNSKFLSFYFRSSVCVFIIYAFNFQSMARCVSLHRALRTLLPVCFLSSVLCVLCHSQVINNACATQAIVSVLLNCSHSDMLLGDTLTEFREFSQSFDAAVRSRYIFWILNCLSVWVVHLFRFMLGCALAVEFQRPSVTCFYDCFPHYHKKE